MMHGQPNIKKFYALHNFRYQPKGPYKQCTQPSITRKVGAYNWSLYKISKFVYIHLSTLALSTHLKLCDISLLNITINCMTLDCVAIILVLFFKLTTSLHFLEAGRIVVHENNVHTFLGRRLIPMQQLENCSFYCLSVDSDEDIRHILVKGGCF